MISLVQATKVSRWILKILGIFLAGFFLIYIVFNIFSAIYKIFVPSPSAFPDNKYGKLPKISFPEQTKSNITYRINTTSGGLPSMPSKLKIYQIKQGSSNLLSYQQAKSKAVNAGFGGSETKISNVVYVWANKNLPDVSIVVNTINNNFRIRSDYLSNPSLISRESAPRNDENLLTVMSIVNNFVGETNAIEWTDTIYSSLKISNGQVETTQNYSEARLGKVELAYKKLGGIPVYSPSFKNSDMYFIIGPRERESIIVDANFNYQSIISDVYSNYPIKSAQEAYKELESGKAYMSNPDNKTNVDILDISLGYYLNGTDQQMYTMPIYVFKGANFTAYTFALKDSSIKD